MMVTADIWWIIPAALLLDLLLGDPRRLPHPVRWMGAAITRFEPLFRGLPLPPVLSGGMFALFLVGSAWATTTVLLLAADGIHSVAANAIRVVLLYYTLSARSLEQAAMAVWRRIDAGDTKGARKRVSWIVGRDTAGLDRGGIIRGAVETVAENFVDGVLAPLFFAALGGVPLAMVYKMTNTLDSMVGYKNEKYRHFGTAAARIDDVANYLPARLSVVFIAAAAQLVGKNGKAALRTGFRDGRQHTSPNAGFPEAAFAGALGVRLGGPGIYHGRTIEKPYLGKEYGPVGTNDIQRACRLMVVTSLLGMAATQIISITRLF